MGLGHDLRFTRDDDISWSPQIALGQGPGQSAAARRFPEIDAAVPAHMRPDPRLLNVWADLREFARLVNDAAATKVKIPIEVVFRLRTSVPHRLLKLRLDGSAGVALRRGGGVVREGLQREGGVPCDPTFLHELLRLSMMAFAKMLLIKLHRIGRRMVVLVDGLTNVLTAWHQDLQRNQATDGAVLGEAVGAWKLVLWSAFVAGISIFEDFSEPWLNDLVTEALSVLGLRTWDETREVLKEFMWVDLIFGYDGTRLFERFWGVVE